MHFVYVAYGPDRENKHCADILLIIHYESEFVDDINMLIIQNSQKTKKLFL